MMNTAIQYHGRKARRAGSERRRQAILEAALRIIARDGIRAVRHRAVAREADVPLSATTYYFKDISDLIADTFTLFAERALRDVVLPFRDRGVRLLGRMQEAGGGHPAEVQQQLADLTTNYILEQVGDHREHVVVEQAFVQAAALDPRLRGLADLYISELTNLLRQACRAFGSANPELDGEVVHARVAFLKVRLLTRPEPADPDAIRRRMLHLLKALAPHG